jgi:hypothetical protein
MFSLSCGFTDIGPLFIRGEMYTAGQIFVSEHHGSEAQQAGATSPMDSQWPGLSFFQYHKSHFIRSQQMVHDQA